MNVLYLTNGFPFPLTSGYLRHYYLLQELNREHDVTLLSVTAPSFRPEFVQEVEPFVKRVETFPSTSRGRSKMRKILSRIESIRGRTEPAVEAMKARAAELARTEEFDAVFCGKRTEAVLDSLPGVPLVADMCDATSVRVRRSLAFASPLRRPWLLMEEAQTRTSERRMMARAQHSLFISCRDREDLIGREVRGTSIMPNGVDVEFWKRTAPSLGRHTIAFTGAMDYRPNTDAALVLIEHVLPKVRAEFPDARLLIVGRDPTAGLKAAGEQEGVDVTGFVPDVRQYLDESTVFAAPIRFGAGIQNKVLEAMSMEIPVVASSLAADGLRTEAGDRPPVRVAESPEEFAREIVAVFREKEEAPIPDTDGRDYIQTNFVWRRSGEILSEVIRSVAKGEPACTP